LALARGDRGRHRLEQPLVVGAGSDLGVDVQQVVDGVGVLVQGRARGGERAVPLRGGRADVVLALLLVLLEARLDLEVLGGDGGAVDGRPLLGEATQLGEAVLDLGGELPVVALEPLGAGAVLGRGAVDGPALLGELRPLPRAVAVDVGERQAALALQLVDQRGEPGRQPGVGVAAAGPGALGLVGADPDEGQDAEHQEWADQGDNEFRSDRDITQQTRT
jgi:hypothetical protein